VRGMGKGRMPAWAIGVAMVIVIAVASFLAYTKELPWGGGEKVSATFASAQTLRESAPVRVAGVQIGEVVEIEPPPPDDPNAGTVVTMELNDEAPELHEDALLKIRPRLFLEGNYFIDVHTGSPSAPAVDEGHTFPVNQTAYSPQIDQLFTTLQGDVRADLQTLLDQFGSALMDHGGAEGFRELHRTSPRAYRFTAEVNEALLGNQPGDLGGMIDGLGRTLRGLAKDEAALQGFVTNLATTTGSFAAEEQALARAIELLPGFMASGEPAFTALNRGLPAMRAFAREILPGVRNSPETLRVATPFLGQMRKLMSEPELRGLARDLRPALPKLGRLNRANLGFLKQQRFLSSCFNEVIIPWSNDTISVDPAADAIYNHEPGGRVFEESSYGITGTAVESRSGDANGQHLRVMGGSGANLVRIPAMPAGIGYPTDQISLTPFPILGAMPAVSSSRKTPFRPNVPCETQEQPDLTGGFGDPDGAIQQDPVASGMAASLENIGGGRALQRTLDVADQIERASELQESGEEDAAADLFERAQRALGRLGAPAQLGFEALGASR
jgi:phospholipid/cholesterol/gamma-HCH transport system substrate-binding protein